ncbi:MAG: molybdopterin cofactor-binding domain-containing protein [Pseudoruegeria sp.]
MHHLAKKYAEAQIKEAQVAIRNVSRRQFLRTGAAGFALAAFSGTGAAAFDRYKTGGDDMPNGLIYNPNVFVSIAPDGQVTIVAHRSEMGQGARTSLPMVLADELGADWDKVSIVQAEGDEPKYGNQNTDGSRSLRHHIQSMRQMGASVRHMLQFSAAQKWGVDMGDVVVGVHEVSLGSQKIGFGELAEAAMALPVPEFEELTFKTEAEFRYVGKGKIGIVDLHDITTGAAIYGADVMLPGMKVAVIARPPAVGETPKIVDDKGALAVPGVESIHMLEGSIMPAGFAPLGGVAVVAAHTDAAIKGRDELELTWAASPHSGYDSDAFMAEMRVTASQPGKVIRKAGDWETAKAGANTVFEREYTQSHMVHAPMEPLVAVANVKADSAEIWGPFQSPYQVRQDVAAAVGLDVEHVRVNVTLLGGGFGRKSKGDYGIEAALLSQKVGSPVKVQWTREDDIRHAFNHTTSVERIEAAIDQDGKVTGMRYNSVAPTILSTFAEDPGYQFNLESGMGHADLPFEVPNLSIENGKAMSHTRIGWFRSVSNIPRAWAVQSFSAELAHELGKDQKDMLLELIGSDRQLDPVKNGFADDFWNYGEKNEVYPIDTIRLKNVLNLAAEKADWGKTLPAGEGLGIAVHRSFVTYVAAVAHVKIEDDGTIRVPEVHMAIDCGFAANPERIRSQMEGAAVMGMTTALHSGVTYQNGAVEEGNFDSYEMVRASNYPEMVHTHIVEHPFSVHAAGVGEPGLPPIPPAIGNAIFAASGKRVRDLPIGGSIEA